MELIEVSKLVTSSERSENDNSILSFVTGTHVEADSVKHGSPNDRALESAVEAIARYTSQRIWIVNYS
jgi:hypothetical protein